MKYPILATALAVALHLSATPSMAAEAPYCRPSEIPRFNFGFASLKATLGAGMGDPVDCEHTTVPGFSPQHTTTGLAYYLTSSNTVVFTATFLGEPYTNWALAPGGLLYFWQGDAPEPPAGAIQLDPAACDTLVQADALAFGVACFDFYTMSLGDPLAAAAPSTPQAPLPAVGQTSIGVSVPGPPSALAPAAASPPSDDQLEVKLSQVDATLSDRFPSVRGQICNHASNWDAGDVTVNFTFYDRNGLRTLDHGSYQVDQVRAGDCQSFSRTLTPLQPWRKIGVGHVDWTWRR